MEDYDWIEMMKKMQDIRLFASLYIRRTQKGGITSAQELDLLSRIVLSDIPLTPQELSERMGLNKSAISRLIERLERKGFFEKQYNSKDKRSYSLHITEKGNQELLQTYRYYLEPIYELRRAIGEELFMSLTGQIREANEILQNRR